MKIKIKIIVKYAVVNYVGFDFILMSRRFQEQERIGGGTTTSVAVKEQTSQSAAVVAIR